MAYRRAGRVAARLARALDRGERAAAAVLLRHWLTLRAVGAAGADGSLVPASGRKHDRSEGWSP